MTLGLVLSIIFVVLKLVGVIQWSWWLVALPELIEIGLGLVALCVWALVVGLGFRSVARRF